MVKRIGIRVSDESYERLLNAFWVNFEEAERRHAVDLMNPTEEEKAAWMNRQLREILKSKVAQVEREIARQAIQVPASLSIEEDI